MMRSQGPSRLARGAVTTALAAALLSAAAGAGAQAIGRLFNTPTERGQLDSGRNALPGGAANAVTSAPGIAPAGTNQPIPSPGADAGQQVPYPGAGQQVPYPGGSAGAPPGGNPADPPPPPPPPQALVMNGVLRTSSGRSTVWLNDIPQSGRQLKVVQRAHSAPQLTIQLPSGKKVLLKPGQRYDLAEGRVKDINEP